jgi:CheY-like chemotaxis protein
MIYGFVKQSEGAIRISREVGVGTTIDIFLPASDAKAEARSSTSLERGALFSTANAEKVLVVDDESELLEVAVNYLEEMGFEILAATDGLHALQTLRANPDIELLLTDIVMPGGMNGVELANTIREERPDLKLLYMSGYPSGVLAERSGTTLDAPLITKPYTREKLATAIDEVLHASA